MDVKLLAWSILDAKLLTWSLLVMAGIWGVVFIIHIIYRRSWQDLMLIPIFIFFIAYFLRAFFESGWVVAGFILLAHVALIVGIIVGEKKRKSRKK